MSFYIESEKYSKKNNFIGIIIKKNMKFQFNLVNLSCKLGSLCL